MRRSRLSLFWGSIVFILLVCANKASAYECMLPGPPCQAFWQTDAVFSATVISKSVITVDTGIESSPKEQLIAVKLLVEDTFRGALGGNDVEIVTGGECGFNFEKGRKYLVYASERRGRLYAGTGSRTRLLSEAGEDLAYFGNLPPENSGSNIRVKVVKRVPPIDEKRNYAFASMQGVKIIADNGEHKYEGMTNSTGEYVFRDLPPGKYKVTSDIPHTERNRWQSEITVTDRACAVVEFWNSIEGKIGGTVFDENGNPANNVKIDLVELDEANTASPTGRSTYTNGSGTYELTDVPPGKYLL
ncbi:MAG TPA: carboxypeptidase regulatory-like domain-containing protein, partial [Pyrinomonadaceae bacterium]